MSEDFFKLLGAPLGYFINKEEIQKRFYELSRSLHPDRFQNKSREELEKATHDFAQLNKALETLKSDDLRAEYIMELANFDQNKIKSTLPPSLAEDYFTLQETLEEVNVSLEKKKDLVGAFQKVIDEQLLNYKKYRLAAFEQWENHGKKLDSEGHPYLQLAAQALKQQSYLKSMARDLEARWLKPQN